MNSAFLPYFSFSKGNNFSWLPVCFIVPRNPSQIMVFRNGEWAFGANLENIYTFFLTVLFWDFELVRDSQNPSDKETFFLFSATFTTRPNTDV